MVVFMPWRSTFTSHVIASCRDFEFLLLQFVCPAIVHFSHMHVSKVGKMARAATNADTTFVRFFSAISHLRVIVASLNL
jgi:hypothetical protein